MPQSSEKTIMVSSLFGFIAITFVISTIIFRGDISSSSIIDYLGILIVLGGTVSASLITFSFKDLLKLFVDLFKVFRSPRESQVSIAQQLVTIAQDDLQKASANQAQFHPFIQDGIKLLQNKLDSDSVREIMTSAIIERKIRHSQSVDMLKALAKYPTAFGMMGTILGLVSLLKGLSLELTESSIGPQMSIALLTTLYGLLLSNCFFHPVAENLFQRTRHDIKIRRMILQGLILVAEGHDPFYIQERVNSYLPPLMRRNLIQGRGKDYSSEKLHQKVS